MFRRLRTRRTRWVVAAVATPTLVGGGVFLAMPAQAATAVTDGFEGNPYDSWTTDDRPGDSLAWLGNHRFARTGGGAAVFDAPFDVPARVHRQVVVDRPSAGPSVCYAEAWVRRGTPTTNPRFRMRIRSGGPNGTVIYSSTYDISNDDYRRAQFATFPYSTATMTVDISVTGGEAFLDDVTVWCIREIQ